MVLKIKLWLVFYRNFLKFRSFISGSKSTGSGDTFLKKYTIIIDPWMLNIAPWFAITTGILLRKKGHHITFLIDNLRFESWLDHQFQINIFKRILKKVVKNNQGYKIAELKPCRPPANNLTNEELDYLKRLAKANAVHKFRGELDDARFRSHVAANLRRYIENFHVLKHYIEDHREGVFIVSGGIYAYSGAAVYLFKKFNIDYFTFDSGFNILMSSYKGVAAHLADLPMALETLKESTSKTDIEFALDKAQNELNARINGTNRFNNQYQKVEDSIVLDDVGFLIPLNSPWDSAALMIDFLFDSYNEWLLETVEMILKNTDEIITIRQHPDERHAYTRSSIDFGATLKRLYPGNKRIQFLSCYDKVNTYALLNKAKAVICFSSTFGVESAMNGKKIIVCSNVYYSKRSFVNKPASKSHLMEMLKDIDIVPPPNTEAIKEASLIFYLGQKCNWLITPFTPMITDYDKWLQIGLDNLLETDSVICFLESLETHIPLSIVNHQYQKRNECSRLDLINYEI